MTETRKGHDVLKQDLQAEDGTSQRILEGLQLRLDNAQTLLAQRTAENLQLSDALSDCKALLDLRNAELKHAREELQTVYGSLSMRVTRPARVLSAILRGFTRHVSALGRAAISRAKNLFRMTCYLKSEWRSLLRQAFSFTRRTLSTGRIDPSDRARMRFMVQMGYSSFAKNLGLPEKWSRPKLAPPGDLADVFVWGVIDWHFRTQRPQHLAASMASKGQRVFYISSNFADSGEAGFVAEALNNSDHLFQINLNLKGMPRIYTAAATAAQAAAIRDSLAKLLGWTETTRSISLVQHPYWTEPAQCLPNMQLVYDCMDHHAGFGDNASFVLEAEKSLVQQSDLIVVTSQWLLDEMSASSDSIALIRNAAEYEHFSTPPQRVFADAQGRRIIGYYGAIAEWFDADLVRKVALDHPDALVVLVGRDTAGVQVRLRDLTNVTFVGEVSYAELPYWLHGFDVCLLPFRVIALTLATNPVKVYEYLSAGKPVVSVNLPEMAQFPGLVELADTAADFSAAVGRALAGLEEQAAQIPIRKAFAASQTWAHRAADLDTALAGIREPRVSVIVLCYNNIEHTCACLDSLEKYSDYPNLELIAVDNASSDETPQVLSKWALGGANRIHIANAANLGFSAGNNVGLAAATGDYLVILNNDTCVTPGWVRSLMRHLRRNPKAGLVGPVTNNISNEARINIEYPNMEAMVKVAGHYTRMHAGISFPITTAAFFCVMLTREAYEKAGPLDEVFGLGFFEDDDYCRRLEKAGFQILCADDTFVHHHSSASFNKMKTEARKQLFNTNRAIYESKWGAWTPHVYRKFE